MGAAAHSLHHSADVRGRGVRPVRPVDVCGPRGPARAGNHKCRRVRLLFAPCVALRLGGCNKKPEKQRGTRAGRQAS